MLTRIDWLNGIAISLKALIAPNRDYPSSSTRTALLRSRGTRAGAYHSLRASSWDDADEALCCFLLCHFGKELLASFAHFRRAQVFFVCSDAPAIAKRIHKAAIAVAPELV
jgi:hypothetical protein